MSKRKKCPECKGEGEITFLNAGYYNYSVSTEPCPTCNGMGYAPVKKRDRTSDRENGIFKKPTKKQMLKIAKLIKGVK
jgi:DnaJ-class molecular chaperone